MGHLKEQYCQIKKTLADHAPTASSAGAEMTHACTMILDARVLRHISRPLSLSIGQSACAQTRGTNRRTSARGKHTQLNVPAY